MVKRDYNWGSTKYQAIHCWLRTNYGKANHCTFCGGLFKKYQWALKKGFLYERNVNNYLQLCVSCHIKYDFTEEKGTKMSNTKNILFATKKGKLLKQKIANSVHNVWQDPEYKKRLNKAKKNWWLTATTEQKEKRISGIKGFAPGPRMKRTKFKAVEQ